MGALRLIPSVTAYPFRIIIMKRELGNRSRSQGIRTVLGGDFSNMYFPFRLNRCFIQSYFSKKNPNTGRRGGYLDLSTSSVKIRVSFVLGLPSLGILMNRFQNNRSFHVLQDIKKDVLPSMDMELISGCCPMYLSIIVVPELFMPAMNTQFLTKKASTISLNIVESDYTTNHKKGIITKNYASCTRLVFNYFRSPYTFT